MLQAKREKTNAFEEEVKLEKKGKKGKKGKKKNEMNYLSPRGINPLTLSCWKKYYPLH